MAERLKFLVFETTTLVRKIATKILTDKGFIVIEASSYDEAVDLCRREMPVGILVDGLLPDDLTDKFIRYIRSLPDGLKPRILFTPLEQEAGKLARILRSGANDYLLRPFTPHHFDAALKRLSLAA